MNKEDSNKEKFKQALQSTYKVISDDYKAVKNKKNDEKVYDIGEIENIWREIDQNDNWEVLYKKIINIRKLGYLLESEKLIYL